MITETRFQPAYEHWRHGGWYVTNVRYASGAVGCVSRNYPDRKWRIVCDHRDGAYERFTYASRDAAAHAEYELAEAEKAVAPRCSCGHFEAAHNTYPDGRAWCGYCGDFETA